jgi:hypothetical protein
MHFGPLTCEVAHFILEGLVMQVRRLFGILAVLIFVGCNSDNGQHPTSKTTVVIKYKGKPVEGATVIFNNALKPAFGITDSAGAATMTTYQTGDGAVIAQHGVSITKMKLDPKLTVGEEIDQEDPRYDPLEKPSVAPPKSLLPNKYTLPATSGIQADVIKGDKNNFEYDLTD